MMPFTVTLSSAVRSELLILVDILFWLFVSIGSICVAYYIGKQIRFGRLVDNRRTPLPFKVSGMAGGFFIVCVLELIFLQSPYYILLVLVGMLGLLLETGRTAAQQFGFARLKPARLLSWSLLGFAAVMLVETPLTEGVLKVFDLIHMPHPEQDSVETFRQYNDSSAILGFVFQAVLLVPIIEELFFRGFLMVFLKNYTSTWVAIVLSAGIFAFAHVNLGAALPLWFLGIALGLAYEHTGSLLLPIGIHACWNFITALSLLLAKGNS